ncbi:MAG: tetratricopeptide repeat protein [Methanomassiliicoccales archaeon]|nr:tetratricopeptide repeat protein [Methanomassiliicoccales archaeon]
MKVRKFKKLILLLPSAGVIFAGLMLIISPVMAMFSFKTVGTIEGIFMLLVFTVFGIWEISTSRAIAGTQIGEWPGVMKALGIAVVLHLFLLLLTADLILQLNLAALALEALAIVLLLIYRKAFMPSKEEVEASLKRFGRTTVKVVSQCPKCSGVVDIDWVRCPDCGTYLPHICANCGTEIKEGEHSCCQCGTVIENSPSLLKMVETLRKTAESEAAPETRSAHYARLGDGLLKAGKPDEAVEAYRTAINHTRYERKRTNLMVKMAVVMANKGHMEEADKLLTEAMSLDPEDVAGAKKVMESLRAEPTCPA